jgi:hypothetical protein
MIAPALVVRVAVTAWITMTVAWPSPALAQTEPPAVTTAPLNILVPNYNGVPAGEVGGLEANAYLARANDASSAFYNPAGLTLATQTSVSGSAGVYQFAGVSPESIPGRGGSLQHIPSLVGLVVPRLLGKERWAAGFSLTRVNAWEQSSDLQRETSAAGGRERVASSSVSLLSGLQANLGVGYAGGRSFRVGGSVDLQMTDSERSQTLGIQYVTDSGLSTLLVESHGKAGLWHVRMTTAAQYDVTPTLRVGLLVRTPGLNVMRDGSSTYEGVLRAGSSTTTASFFDTSPDVEYRIPLEFKAGVSWVGKRAQIEMDLLSHAPGGRYPAFRTGEAWTLVTDPGSGSQPSTQQPALTAPFVDSRAVVNLAIGGQLRLKDGGAWTVHGGYATDRSPVGADDTLYTRVNMQVVTAGISGRAKIVLGSVGVRYQAGTTDDIVLRQLHDGPPVRTRLKISNLGLVYSVAVRF